MTVELFDKSNQNYISEAAKLLAMCFPHCYADCADQEMSEILGDERVSVMAIENGHLVGLVGAIPQYGKTGWELHPLAVGEKHQGRDIGTALMQTIEKVVAALGGIMIYLGTDDEFGKTSLSGADLFEDTYAKIADIKNLNRHPYEFYQKAGYKIVGVIPDANGIGKPDILMAKRICAESTPQISER
jgi:aminoglycoside 6'-N-acetyltransferase I